VNGTKLWTLVFLVAFLCLPLAAQQGNPPPPPPPASPVTQEAPPPPQPVGPDQLNELVKRIALYPDPLLAQALTASTFWDQIPDGDAWADEHAYLKGDALAQAIRDDNLQWDPSVLALLPFPSVLDMMAHDPAWTQQLGQAVLNQRGDVMDAVQRMRRQAYKYGYLRSDPYDTVTVASGYYQILPVNPAYIYVPTYNPGIVFGPPGPGIVISAAIGFGPAVIIGPAFAPWGWTHPYFLWGAHGIFFDNVPWGRNWMNRGYYVHPYAHPWFHRPGPRVERHSFRHR
jgi:hypothetical protein